MSFLPKRHIAGTGLLIACILNVVAQPQTDFWHFGMKAGVNFNSGAPVAFTNSQLSDPSTVGEGCSSISDASGNLLFYTNGVKAWDKNDNVMPAGTGLLGHGSCTQSCVIVPFPANNSKYYVFTNGADASNINREGLNYSVVDMSLNGGLGDVTVKNTNIVPKDKTTEKLAAIKHCNGKDYWVVTHESGNNTFDAFLVTSTGVTSAAVKSNIGIVHTSNDKLGYMKISADGKKLAVAVFGKQVELFDFDNSTGTVTNPMTITAATAVAKSYYGVEFSPDRSKLYVTTFGSAFLGSGQLFQFNLNAGSVAAINASAVFISSPATMIGTVQLASNGKIYLTKSVGTWLGVINNPNNAGLACNYVNNAVSLAGKNSGLGLPNFVQSFFYTPPSRVPTSFRYKSTCFSSLTSFSINDTSKIQSVAWNFNDPSSTNDTSTLLFPSYVFSTLSNYNVQLIINYKCFSDTILQVVKILPLPVVNAGADTTICSSAAMLNGFPSGGTNYQWLPITGLACPGCIATTAFPPTTTNYKLMVTDNNGCTGIDSMLVIVNCPAVLVVGASVCKGTCFMINAVPIGGTAPYTYSWSNGVTSITNMVCPLVTTAYTVTLTDAFGFTSVDSTTVTVLPDVTASLTKTDNNCYGESNGSISVNPLTGSTPFAYSWSNGITNTANIFGLIAGNYNVVVTDANGCTAILSSVVVEPTKLLPGVNGVKTICYGDSAVITASASGGTSPYLFSWTPGGASSSSVKASPDSTKIYSVIVTDNNGCTADTAFEVMVSQLPEIKYSVSDSEGCAPLCVNFINQSNAVSCIWDLGGGNFSVSDDFVKCYNSAGDFPFSLTITDVNGCSNTLLNTGIIKVHPVPVAAFLPNTNQATILSPVIDFKNNSVGANAFVWDFGDGVTSNVTSLYVSHTYEDTSTYNVMLIAMNEFGCKDTAYKNILIKSEYEIFVPNAFTPNGDGANEIFMPLTYYKEVATFNMSVFDRWGDLIFETNNLNIGWDGIANGGTDIAQEDVYIWKVSVKLLDGEKHNYTGHVTLIK